MRHTAGCSTTQRLRATPGGLVQPSERRPSRQAHEPGHDALEVGQCAGQGLGSEVLDPFQRRQETRRRSRALP